MKSTTNGVTVGRATTQNNNRGSSMNTTLFLSAFLSGIVCYRLGAFSGCSSPWMANIQATHSSTVDSIHVDIDDPAYFRSSVHLRSTPQTTSIDPHDRRFVARPSTPYKCGKITLYCML